MPVAVPARETGHAVRLALRAVRRYRVELFFFFQAEDGIRDLTVTGVQTCALPISSDIEEFIEKLKEAAEANRELFLGSIRMLAAAIDEKDPYTRGHSGRVAKYSTLIGRELGLSDEELDRLRIAALLHDVGKIGVDDRVLKKPGALTAEEFELMKQHTVKGANIMRPVSQLKEMLPGIELHHEHMDGRGYPYGVTAPQIPLMARVIAVADTLDAMPTNRP